MNSAKRILRLIRRIFENLFLFFDEHFLLILFGIPVGICGGLASVALNRSIHLASSLLPVSHSHGLFIFFPAIGALLSIFCLSAVFRESAGHAVPLVIHSVTRKGGLLQLRSSLSHLIGCLCTISFGGSAGPEAPVVVSGSSIGSNIARLFHFKERQRIVMVGCGIAAAISAIFNAPIAGIVFAVEVILGEWASVNLVPIAIASVVATQTSRILQGNQIPFDHRVFIIDTMDIIACLGLAVLVSVAAVLLSKTLFYVEHASKRLFRNIYMRGAAGGLCVGCIGWFAPDVLGEGYETIRAIIEDLYAPPLLFMTLLIFCKIAATSLTLGTGSAGGVFAPALVIGCFVGLAYSEMINALWPANAWTSGGCFALLGMAGMISGVLHAPLTGIFLIVEITGGYEVILPLILVSVLASTITRAYMPASVYYRELMERGQLLRPRTDARILADIAILDILKEDLEPLPPEMTLREFVNRIKNSPQSHFPVIDPETEKFHGLVLVDMVQSYLLSPELYDAIVVEEIMESSDIRISPNDNLLRVMDHFEQGRTEVLPVIDRDRFIGTVSKADVLAQYRKELIVQMAH
ncbi:MAG: chloride channel protein [Candidatus Omnitrophota bacterium]|jgi:CIC family chloride channel protein|nr:MAG: chloride channel protein [Candidatus Omnitrophota bacterium]